MSEWFRLWPFLTGLLLGFFVIKPAIGVFWGLIQERRRRVRESNGWTVGGT